MIKSIIILHKHDGESKKWSEIPESQLDTWMNDGSIEEGDIIIYPRKSMSVTLKKTLQLNDTLRDK